MSQINNLPQKASISDADLLPIWNSEQSRTGNTPASSLKPYLKYVENITVTGSVLTVYYSDGTQKDLNI